MTIFLLLMILCTPPPFVFRAVDFLAINQQMQAPARSNGQDWSRYEKAEVWFR